MPSPLHHLVSQTANAPTRWPTVALWTIPRYDHTTSHSGRRCNRRYPLADIHAAGVGVTVGPIALSSKTADPQIDAMLRGMIGIHEMVFPMRVRAYYLVGSYHTGHTVPASDLDIVVVFRGSFLPGEESVNSRYAIALGLVATLTLLVACRPTPVPTSPTETLLPVATPTVTPVPTCASTLQPTSTSTSEPTHPVTPTPTNPPPPPTLIPALTNTPQPTSTSMPTRTPIQLELLGHIGGTIEAMVVRGKYAYVGGEYGFSVLDVSNPSQVVEVGYLALPVADLEVVGKYAYVAAKEAGLQVVDISDPLAPLRVGACVTPGEAVAIAVESGESRRRVYLSIAKKGLWTIDVSDAAKPIEIGNYKLDAWIGDVSMLSIDATQTYAYLATSDGLRVVNVSVPQSPVDWLRSSGGPVVSSSREVLPMSLRLMTTLLSRMCT